MLDRLWVNYEKVDEKVKVELALIPSGPPANPSPIAFGENRTMTTNEFRDLFGTDAKGISGVVFFDVHRAEMTA